MKNFNFSIGGVLIIAALFLLLGWYLNEYVYPSTKDITIRARNGYKLVTFRLPTDGDPDVFGPKYWKARHALAHLTPCGSCRGEAVSHEIFFHDWVNKKLNKPLFDKENYDKWIKRLTKPSTSNEA